MTDDRMPTICLSCGEAIPAADYMEHRRHCQADVEADNRRMGADPVKVLAREVRTLRNVIEGGPLKPTDEDRAIAAQFLQAVWTQDWRIVRLAECEPEFDDDGNEVPCWTVVYEWTPEAAR